MIKNTNQLSMSDFFEAASELKNVWWVSGQGTVKEIEFQKVVKSTKYPDLEIPRFHKFNANIFLYDTDIILDETVKDTTVGPFFEKCVETGQFFLNKADMTECLKNQLSTMLRSKTDQLDLLVKRFPELLV